MTTSIDGGQTFSQDVPINPENTATDAITGKTVDLSAQLDKLSGVVPAPPYGYGIQTGLAVYDGQVYPVWAGNFNLSTAQPIQGDPLDVYYRPVVIAAGPRIVSSTQGAIPLPDSSNPQTTFQVTFDRPIDPSRIPTPTFTPSDVQVFYNGTQTVTQTATGLPMPILPPQVDGTNPPAGSSTPYRNLYTITVANPSDANQTITAAELNLSLNFPRNADLTISLSDTQGRSAILWTPNHYYDQGQNFTNTTFTDTAAQSIESLSGAPYTGSFQPYQSLNAAFAGSKVNDTYTLEIDTAQPLEYGQLLNWTLTLHTDSQFIPLDVTNVQPDPTSSVGPSTGWFGYTTFNVTFDPTKRSDGTASGITNFTGTYSYLIEPKITTQVQYVNNRLPQDPIGPTGIDVNFTIAGSHDGNLTISLIAPNGRSVVLYQNSLDGTTVGFDNVTFSDFGSVSFLNALPPANTPYASPPDYYPLNPLSNLEGGPVNGQYTLQIHDSGPGPDGSLTNFSIVVRSMLSGTPVNGSPMDQNADGTAGEDPLVTPFTGLTPGDVYATPMPQPLVPTTFGTDPLSILSPPFNMQTLPLIVPGPHVVNTFVPNVTPSSDNLVLNATNSVLDVTFDRPMQVSSFTPANVLQIMGPAGPIVIPQTFSAPSTSLGPIPDATTSGSTTTPGTLSSTLSVPQPTASGTFPVGKVTVQLSITDPGLSDLSAVLIAPDGTTEVTLFNAGDLSGANLSGTTFDDAATQKLSAGTAPYTGTFQISDPATLAHFLGASAIGNWTLEVTDHATGQKGTLKSWSLTITPQVAVTAVNPATFNGQLAATTFQIGFPQQFLSGTYTIQLGPNALLGTNISDTYDQAIDTNQNAGLDVLRGQGNNVPTATVVYGTTTSVPIAAASSSTVPGQIMSTINVPDNFVIPTGTPSGRTGIRVQLDITYSNDPDLTAILYYHYGRPTSNRSRSSAAWAAVLRPPTSATRCSTTRPQPRSSRQGRPS